MKATDLFLSVILCLFMFGCNKLCSDEKLSMQREDYVGNELRVDGYYYIQDEKHQNTSIKFLYQNGIILTGGGYSGTDLNVVEAEMVKVYSEIRKHKNHWGVFSITNDQILTEAWDDPLGGCSLPTVKCRGYIQNDTTFHIVESYFSNTKKTYYSDKVWYFKQFFNKPDSTNNFIK